MKIESRVLDTYIRLLRTFKVLLDPRFDGIPKHAMTEASGVKGGPSSLLSRCRTFKLRSSASRRQNFIWRFNHAGQYILHKRIRRSKLNMGQSEEGLRFLGHFSKAGDHASLQLARSLGTVVSF